MNTPFRYKIVVVAVGVLPWIVSSAAVAVCPMTQTNESSCPNPSVVSSCATNGMKVLCEAARGQIKLPGAFSCKSSSSNEECVDAVGVIPCYKDYQCFWDVDNCKEDFDDFKTFDANFKKTIDCP